MPAAKPSYIESLRMGLPLSQGVDLAYPLADGGGTNCDDLSGRLNTGVFHGTVTWTGGPSGWCLQFDGSTGYVQTAANVLNPAATPLTAAAWVMMTSLQTTGSRTIIAQANGTGTGRDWINTLKLTTGAKPVVFNSVLGGSQTSGTTALAANTWYHVAVTLSGTALSLYLNGSPEASSTRTAESATGASLIAVAKSLTANFWAGSIDGILIYNRALSQSEIAQLYMDSWVMFRRSRTILKATVSPITEDDGIFFQTVTNW